MKGISVPALLSLNGGFVDTVGFLGLQGLFTAHVTGNFVTLAATSVSGTHGVIAKRTINPPTRRWNAYLEQTNGRRICCSRQNIVVCWGVRVAPVPLGRLP
jgi:hypothetical protein